MSGEVTYWMLVCAAPYCRALQCTALLPHLAAPLSGRSAGGGSVCLRLLLRWRCASTSPATSSSKSMRLWLVVSCPSWAQIRLIGDALGSGLQTDDRRSPCIA